MLPANAQGIESIGLLAFEIGSPPFSGSISELFEIGIPPQIGNSDRMVDHGPRLNPRGEIETDRIHPEIWAIVAILVSSWLRGILIFIDQLGP